jgi:tetratricopeptide (TPR) repeat protein
VRRLGELWREGRALARADLLAEAFELRAEGRYEESARTVVRLLRQEPENLRARWLAETLVLQPDLDRAERTARAGELVAAEAQLRRLIERFPDAAEPRLRLAPLLVTRAEADEAAAYCRRAAQLSPHDPHALFRAADCLRWSDTVGTRELVHRLKALLEDPAISNQFVFATELGRLEGLLAFDEGRGDAGLSCLERAFAEDPSAVGIAGDLAEGYLHLGRSDDALALIEQELQRRPDDGRLHRLRERASGSGG